MTGWEGGRGLTYLLYTHEITDLFISTHSSAHLEIYVRKKRNDNRFKRMIFTKFFSPH